METREVADEKPALLWIALAMALVASLDASAGRFFSSLFMLVLVSMFLSRGWPTRERLFNWLVALAALGFGVYAAGHQRWWYVVVAVSIAGLLASRPLLSDEERARPFLYQKLGRKEWRELGLCIVGLVALWLWLVGVERLGSAGRWWMGAIAFLGYLFLVWRLRVRAARERWTSGQLLLLCAFLALFCVGVGGLAYEGDVGRW